MHEGNKVIQEELQGTAMLIESPNAEGKKLYIESYGCQMNFSDSEIVASILTENGYSTTRNLEEAEVILLNTCSIRDNAEQRVRNRLMQFNTLKRRNPSLSIGILGCMAERLKKQLLEEEKLVDLVAGPDAYRDLPNLLGEVEDGSKAVNVLLSREETYGEITPMRLNSNGITAFISIMRGCDNMCSFCVVPFTRGRERSRDPKSIVHEANYLFNQGYREVTLLGQNVDSYRWNITKKGEIENPDEPVVNFAGLLETVALVNPDLRVRFSTSHPKDMTDDVLQTMAKYDNICEYIHLPVQSGNNRIFEMMNRGYTREWYLDRIAAIRKFMPECGISTDIITGFCSETDEEHQDTVRLMQEVEYDFAYMFKYSERPKTLAERKYEDDVAEDVKTSRLTEIINLQQDHSLKRNRLHIGKIQKVLIEGNSKRSDSQYMGRNTQNAVVVFDKGDYLPGDYVIVKINDCSAATLFGDVVEVTSRR
jgi:tRNA-2-methylthio-N6-dimethylallyladenosine synthase